MIAKCTVIGVNGDIATVRTERKSACEQCHVSNNGKGCGACDLFLGDDSFTAEAENRIGARVGDEVQVQTPSSYVILSSALLFILPLACAGIFYAVTYFCISNTYAPIGALAGVLISFFTVFAAEKKAQKKKPKIVITQIINEKRGLSDDTQ